MASQHPLGLAADLPLVWETPEVLRFGVARAVTRIIDSSPAEQRFLSAMARGIPPDQLSAVTQRCGLSANRRDALISRIRPALGLPAPRSWARPSPPVRVCIAVGGWWADDSWARVFAGALGAAGAVCTIASNAAALIDAELLVLPERYAAPHAQATPWLSRGVPTLSVRLRDRSVLLGPILGHPGSPCLDCCNRAESERDEAWATVTAQVSGSRPPSETPAVALAVASHTATLLNMLTAARTNERGTVVSEPRPHEEAGDAAASASWDVPGFQLDLPVLHGLPQLGGTHRIVPRHADCACTKLSSCDEAIARAGPVSGESETQAGAGVPIPAASRKRDGVRRARPPAADPESRSSSRARVNAT